MGKAEAAKLNNTTGFGGISSFDVFLFISADNTLTSGLFRESVARCRGNCTNGTLLSALLMFMFEVPKR